MATFHAVEVQRENLSQAVTEEVSKYSESLRNRLGSITDYKQDFSRAFDGFVENTLPKDDLYLHIEKQFQLKNKKKGKDNLLG